MMRVIPISCSLSRSFTLLPLFFKFFALAAFVAGMAVSSQAQDKVEVYGAYSSPGLKCFEGGNWPSGE